MRPVRAVVVGAGYMGRNHASCLSQMENVELVAAVDIREDRCAAIVADFGCETFRTTEELLARGPSVDVAIVAAPTSEHLSIGKQLLDHGIHCLVEKPIAPTAAQAMALERLARSRCLVLWPGHIERFNPAVVEVKKRIKDIAHIVAYRVGAASFRSTDIDVIDDLMLHDLDLVLFLSGCQEAEVEVTRVVRAPNGLNDLANVHLRLGRMTADLTSSRLGIARRRKMRIFCNDGSYYSLDCVRRRSTMVSRDAVEAGRKSLRVLQLERHREPSPDEVFEAMGGQVLAGPGFKQHDPLSLELERFVAATRGERVDDTVSGRDGVQVLELIEKIKAHVSPEGTILGPLLG